MKPTLSILMTAAISCCLLQPANAQQRHALFIVSTNGGSFQAGLLRPNGFPAYIADRVENLQVGTSVTVVAYAKDAGYYPSCTVPSRPIEVFKPIRTDIGRSRLYWSNWSVGHGGILYKSPQAGSRLDKALRLALEDRINWPRTAGSVDVYFLTDGGFDVAPIAKPAEYKMEATAALKYADDAFRVFREDKRIKSVHVYGLTEESASSFGSIMRRDRSIGEQWSFYWLRGAPNLDVKPAVF